MYKAGLGGGGYGMENSSVRLYSLWGCVDLWQMKYALDKSVMVSIAVHNKVKDFTIPLGE